MINKVLVFIEASTFLFIKNKRTMEQKEIKPQKPFSQKKKITKKPSKKVIDQEKLLELSTALLMEKDLYLLECKMKTIRDDTNIYAVIHKKDGATTHIDCITATKAIKEIIAAEGFDEEDYSITVSSTGFDWIFKSDLEYQIFINNNVKIKYEDTEQDKNITLMGTLKENNEDHIIIENKETMKVMKKYIIKIKLNN